MQTINNIGIFDSGAGGLTVLKSLIEEVGFNHIVYYGDTARPYGNKDTELSAAFRWRLWSFFQILGLIYLWWRVIPLQPMPCMRCRNALKSPL